MAERLVIQRTNVTFHPKALRPLHTIFAVVAGDAGIATVPLHPLWANGALLADGTGFTQRAGQTVSADVACKETRGTW